MSETWAIRFQLGDAASLSRLRQRPDLEVCELPDALWLRVANSDKDLDVTMQALRGTRFIVLPDRQLVPVGRHIPKGYLPEGPWIGLSQWMSVRLEPAAFSGKLTDRIGLRIVRGGEPAEANILLTDLDAWRAYGTKAPQIRLHRLAFAISDVGQVLIRGTPLPPLRGTRFVERSGVAVPAGWSWTPAMGAEVVREAFGLVHEDLALLQCDGSWSHIRTEDFVHATRSAVRMSIDSKEND